MSKKIPPRDPEGAYVRRTTAARRAGSRKCQCGEDRPEALIPNTTPTICAACQRKKQGKAVEDQHHPAGAANHPLTIAVPVNDHRAELSTAQHDWPKETRENPRGSPLLSAAGCVRGVIDTLFYLVKTTLGWIPVLLEALDASLSEHFGPRWWERWGLAMPAR